jgi:hypothetical protein
MNRGDARQRFKLRLSYSVAEVGEALCGWLTNSGLPITVFLDPLRTQFEAALEVQKASALSMRDIRPKFPAVLALISAAGLAPQS